MEHRLIPNFIKEIRAMKKAHENTKNTVAEKQWEKIQGLRRSLIIDELGQISTINKIKQAFKAKDYQTASDEQINLYDQIAELRGLYRKYKNNILE